MSGKLEIINLALSRLGESPIQSLEEGSVPANTAKIMYDASRRAVLRDYLWSFALRRQALARYAGDGSVSANAFALPSDCIRAVRLVDADGQSPSAFEVRGNTLYTEAEKATLEYVADVDDSVLFDAAFVEALSLKLASDLAMPVKGSAELMGSFSNAYSVRVREGATLSATEQKKELSDNPYVEARLWP